MEGVELMVAGTIARAGDLYVTSVKIIDPASDRTVQTVTVKGKGVESLVETQIDELSRAVAKGVGISGGKLDEGAGQSQA